jgi:hypothetical protein
VGKHPQVIDTTYDDRAEEGVFLGNDLTTPNFWMYSFRVKKVMMLSDASHVHEDGNVPVDVVLTLTGCLSIARFRGASAPLPLLPLLQFQGRRCENISIR